MSNRLFWVFFTERGSKYLWAPTKFTTERIRKDPDTGNMEYQPVSSLTVFLTENDWLAIKQAILSSANPAKRMTSVSVHMSLEPEVGLFPFEIWYSPKRNRQYLISDGKLTLFNPGYWFNGKDFHVGHSVTGMKRCWLDDKGNVIKADSARFEQVGFSPRQLSEATF